jgi:type IV secretion system protein VirD4
VLVLAVPRAGKTSCVVIPALGAHPGAAVATSTKPELLQATLQARRALGDAWFFDLQGHGTPAGCRTLSWSPVTRSGDWQQAQRVAEAMTGAAEHDTDAAHWQERASALIACCLYAAAHAGASIRQVSAWVLRHDVDAPLAELDPDSIAHDVLYGIKHTSERERASIFSTAARVLRAYRSEVALQASSEPNFDPTGSSDPATRSMSPPPPTSSGCSPPLVVGLLTEIRQATYRQAFQHRPARPVRRATSRRSRPRWRPRSAVDSAAAVKATAVGSLKSSKTVEGDMRGPAGRC